ncbi:MAG: hypothetical protein K1X42_02400 [Opitutaceae bacterium]|nr:hypothetical protein [Opitutaceae bacterium]
MKGYLACLGVVLLLAGCCCVAASPEAKSSAYDFSEFREKYPWTVSRELIARGVPGSVPETVIDEALVPTYTLPDLFVSQSSDHITTPAAWEGKRRKELLGLFESEVFGHAPPKPEKIAFEQVDQDLKALDGRATLRRIAITLREGEGSFTFHFTLVTPNHSAGKSPVFLFLNYRGICSIQTKGPLESVSWPVAYALERGFAMAALDLSVEVDPDKPNATTGLRAFYRKNFPRPAELTWGTLGSWAWAASRVVDYLVTAPDIDASKIAIVGHSRGGKTVLWAGAQDERIALVVPNNPGDGGPTIVRRRFGNTIEVMTGRNPHWFTAKYATYAHREGSMPIDQHMLVALVAPRGYHSGDGSEDLWHDPRGSWIGLVEASKVWALYGNAKSLHDPMPLVNDLLIDGPIAYHLRAGGHGLLLFDWKLYFDHADFLFGRR